MTGIIDIGSNSVRLLYSGKKTIITTRLAENMRGDVLNEASILRTVDAVKTLYDISGGNCVAFATEAVRKACNKSDFLDKVRMSTGLNVHVLSGEEEAKISFLGATMGRFGDAVVIDLGGASCEVVAGSGGKIEFIRSYPFGCVTMTDRFKDDGCAIEKYVNELMDLPHLSEAPCFAVGGTVTSLAAMAMDLSEYDPLKVNGFTLGLSDISRVISALEGGKRYATLSPAREKTIKAGAAALSAVIKKLGADHVTVSESDNLEGYNIEYLLK